MKLQAAQIVIATSLLAAGCGDKPQGAALAQPSESAASAGDEVAASTQASETMDEAPLCAEVKEGLVKIFADTYAPSQLLAFLLKSELMVNKDVDAEAIYAQRFDKLAALADLGAVTSNGYNPVSHMRLCAGRLTFKWNEAAHTFQATYHVQLTEDKKNYLVEAQFKAPDTVGNPNRWALQMAAHTMFGPEIKAKAEADQQSAKAAATKQAAEASEAPQPSASQQ